MHALSKLDASGIDDAANSVFLWLSVYLFMAVVSIYKIAKTIMKHAYETTAERVSDGTKLFAGMMIIFGLFIALAASGDTFELAVTFPAWGTLIFLLVFFLVWIATRWFFLNRDDIASYTIEAGRRTNIDEQWNKQTEVKRLLLKKLILWFCGDVFAIGWLMHLTNHGPSSLLSFLNS